jgi:hypothetical protein
MSTLIYIPKSSNTLMRILTVLLDFGIYEGAHWAYWILIHIRACLFMSIPYLVSRAPSYIYQNPVICSWAFSWQYWILIYSSALIESIGFRHTYEWAYERIVFWYLMSTLVHRTKIQYAHEHSHGNIGFWCTQGCSWGYTGYWGTYERAYEILK